MPMMSRRVLLPQPLGPVMSSFSPRRTSRRGTLLPTAQELNTPDVAAARGSRVELVPLSLVEAAKQIKPRVEAAGGEWKPEFFQWLKQRYSDGVPQEQLDMIVAELSGPGAASKTPLRVVKTA